MAMELFKKALPMLIIITAFALAVVIVWYWYAFQINSIS